jgi:hypothetical protein
MYTAYLTKDKTFGRLLCDGISKMGANGTFAYQGYLGTTVEEHYLGRHGIPLRYPSMRMIFQDGGVAKKGPMAGEKSSNVIF